MNRSLLRIGIPALGLLLAIAGLSLVASLGWVGRSFPGFLVLENRVVASVGLERWPATRDGRIYQHEVIAMDGLPLATARELTARVRALEPGTPVTWRFQRGDRAFERTVAVRRFGWADFTLLFGAYLLNGVVMGGTALLLWLSCRHRRALHATVPFLTIGALWGLTATDLYGPYRLFRLHALCEVLLFPTALQLALHFPRPCEAVRRSPWLTWIPYAAALGLAGVYQLSLQQPAAYVASHLLATGALGLALFALVASQLGRLVHPPSAEIRRQSGVLALAIALSVALPLVLTIAEPFTGGRSPQNAVAFTAFLLPLAIGYALLHTDLAAARELARRTAR